MTFSLPSTSCLLKFPNRELKKLRRQLQGKRLIKIELCVMLSLSRLFHVDHVVQNRRSALSLARYEWFSCKGKVWKIYCCELPSSTEPQIWKFPVVVWQTTSKHCTKKRAARAARLFFLFNQSNHWFVALSLTLPSSDLKLPDRELKKLRRQLQGKRLIKIELCVKLSLLWLFHVDHVVQNRRSALSLAWHEWF